MHDPWVAIDTLTFSHADRMILERVDINVQRGKITAIMGPSGSGKTTLLHLIGGMQLPDKGTVFVNQQNIHQLPSKFLAKARKNMGFLFQHGALFTDMSVFDNVAFPLREHTRIPEEVLRHVVLMKLESVGLRGAAHLMPSELSGGMARRVAFARAMALDPDFLMLDEPFTGQDPISMGVLVRLVKRVNTLLNTTILIVSHDVEETCAIADYVYVIAKGRVIGHGTPDEVRASQSPDVQQFIQGDADGTVPFHYPAKPYAEELFDA